jgi:Xaa-Pro aminopeptidase
MDHHSQRRQKLLETLHQEELDALLLSSPFNVTYLTGFTGEASYLIIGRQRTLLVSDFRFTVQLAEECPDLDVHIRPPSQPLALAVGEVLGKLGFRSVGFESGHLTVAEWETLREQTPGIDWKPGRDRVEQLRAVKDEAEITEIRQAIAIAERAFTAFRALLRPSDSEKDLADALEMYVRRCGGSGTAFPPIVAAGERAALPHAPPTARRVEEAELLLVDWGATGRLYKSDLTRTLATRRISPKLEEVYTVVLNAQQQALQCIRPGVRACDVDAAARRVIAEAGYGEFFGHGLGHGFGLQIHEAPFLRPGNEAVLQAGMVLTIEPGIYLPEWGGVRIEDDVLVTPDGGAVLTSVARDLAGSVVEW